MEEDVIAAFLTFDIWGKLEEVLLRPSRPGFASFDKQRNLEVLQIAASYMMRQAQGDQTTPDNRQIGDDSSSYSGLLSAGEFILPAVVPMTDKELQKGFKNLGIGVVTGAGEMIATVIKIALRDLDLGIGFALGELTDFPQPQMVTFTAPDQQQFYAWMSLNQSLHIIPADHPEFNGMTQAFLVNGAMNSLITGQAVESVFAPQGSSLVTTGGGPVSTWSSVTYPFYSKGDEITLSLSGEDLLSREGVDELKRVLLALLGVNNTYVAVSGGFNSPYTSSSNVARAAGISHARGSEDWCVWAYETLAHEGRLDNASIPDWFFTEGWLEAYGQYGS